MKSGKKRFYIIIGVVAVALAALAYLRIQQNTLDASRVTRPAPIVETGAPRREHLTRELTHTGDILPIQQANIYSRVTGNIERMYVDIGTAVKQGQVLALIDTTLYTQTARQTYSQWKQMEASLENTRATLERTKALLQKNLVSKQEMDNAETAFKVAQANVDAAQAVYRNAVTQLAYCRITAPFSGYITKRMLDAGAYVNNVPTAASSTLYTLMDTDTLKIMVSVLERDVHRISGIRSALVQADAVPDSVFHGTVRRVGEAVDLATRTFPVEVDIPNHSNRLKPGMFATTRLVLEEIDSALTVPADAVLNVDEGSFVYTVSPDSLAHKHKVTLGILQNNRAQITEGIADNDRIVIVGQQLLRDGMKVRIAR